LVIIVTNAASSSMIKIFGNLKRLLVLLEVAPNQQAYTIITNVPR